MRFLYLLALLLPTLSYASSGLHFVRIEAHNKHDRSAIVNLGVSIDTVVSDSVYATVSDKVLRRIQSSSHRLLETFPVQTEFTARDFPDKDSKFHNYDEMVKAIDDIVAAHPKFTRKFSIGKSLEGTRDIWCVEINTSKVGITANPRNTFSLKPAAVFMGAHHAREHVSVEIPLMLLDYLTKNYGTDPQITALIKSRDIFIIPMVNPDGAEYDIRDGQYHMHRKNTRHNSDGSVGVDLNRNYGYMWNHGGASSDPSDETYMGPAPFSEPETQAIKGFVEAHPNIRTLLTYHTFSELILYPWGHTNDKISDPKDLETFEKMAHTMAAWNGYTPEPSSTLYIASGDTVDWAYGMSLTSRDANGRIFPFTFELSPKDQGFGGGQNGFYPGEGVLDQVFEANIKPALYMIDLADDPYRALEKSDARLSWLE